MIARNLVNAIPENDSDSIAKKVMVFRSGFWKKISFNNIKTVMSSYGQGILKGEVSLYCW
jgi:hypothetical protein